MARCQCGAELTGRRQKCDACKKRPGKVATTPPAKKTAARKPPAKKAPARRAPAKKVAAKKTTAPPKTTPAVDTDAPAGLHDRGRGLWTALGQNLDTPAGQIALEACRAADRLDELDSIIAGKGVLNLMKFRLHERWGDEGDRTVLVEVKFQSALAEARQQAASFKVLLAELSDVVPAAPAKKAAGPKKSPLDELAERRAGKK